MRNYDLHIELLSSAHVKANQLRRAGSIQKVRAEIARECAFFVYGMENRDLRVCPSHQSMSRIGPRIDDFALPAKPAKIT